MALPTRVQQFIVNDTFQFRPGFLEQPLYGYTNLKGGPHRPNVSEILFEWFDSVNFLKNRKRLIPFVSFVAHILTFAFAFVFFSSLLTPKYVVFLLLFVLFQGTFYNTFWFHRYCSHRAFTFRSLFFAKFFLWTNPFFFREESYAIAHYIHHQQPDMAGDPYGPHLGWLGSYLAIESIQKINTSISEEQYGYLIKRVSHIGFKAVNYKSFQRSGSIEHPGYFILRSFFAQLFYTCFFWFIGGFSAVVTWYASVAVTFFLVRDFNWRGHGGFGSIFNKSKISLPKNQAFYGYLAAEWHKNHHKYPMSANNGFFSNQLDLACQFIKFLRNIGIISNFIDSNHLSMRASLVRQKNFVASYVSK